MKAEELRREIAETLAGIENGAQESGWLVERATAIPVSEILFQKTDLEENEIRKAREFAERRRKGEPLQYILGDEYFGDLLLKVGPGCLIPRPETWGFVEKLLPLLPHGGTFCELGVGSGAVSLAIAHARSDVRVMGSELSPEALRWARRNLAAYGFANVEFRPGSLFEPFAGMQFDAVAGNLPYIPRAEKENLQREVREHEPEIALFAEGDGSGVIRRAIRGLKEHLKENGTAMFEAGSERSGEQGIIIKAEAVADYRPAKVGTEKIKKKEGDMSIPLTRTRDILGWLGERRRPGQILCGFSMETENLLENSRAKLEKKHVDMIIANNLKVEGAGFAGDTNVITVITRDEAKELPLMSKDEAAHRILDLCLAACQKEYEG